jgi:hypothetical protein
MSAVDDHPLLFRFFNCGCWGGFPVEGGIVDGVPQGFGGYDEGASLAAGAEFECCGLWLFRAPARVVPREDCLGSGMLMVPADAGDSSVDGGGTTIDAPKVLDADDGPAYEVEGYGIGGVGAPFTDGQILTNVLV